MFNKPSPGGVSNEFETVIGPSVKVKGDFNAQGNIVVDGTVDGSLKTAGNLEVGEQAKVTANIEAKEAKIGGQVKGNIKIKGFLEITAAAKITGDVEAALISIEKGAMINGQCSMPSGAEETKKNNKDKES